MIAVGKWFERGFTFDIPIQFFPNMVERLRGTPVRLEEKAAGLSPEILTRRQNGSWSIQEHIGHLVDLEALHTIRLQEFLEGARLLSAADINNQKTHNANHNGEPIHAILQAFRTDRSHFIAMAERLEVDVVSRAALHPRLQKMMNVLDLCYFMAEHDDQHLARINELLHPS